MTLHKVKLLGAGILALAVLTGGAIGLARAQADVPVPTEVAAAADPLEELWEDLASTDDTLFSRALVQMAISPRETVAFLKDRLPAVSVDSSRVEQLFKSLDSNEFTARNRAEADLEYLGKFVKAMLQKALTEDRPLEVKKRLQDLLGRLPKSPEELAPPQGNLNNVLIRRANGFVPLQPESVPTGPSVSWVRAVRAIALLEVIGTPEARQVLETLSLGEDDALPTTAARESLRRLANKHK